MGILPGPGGGGIARWDLTGDVVFTLQGDGSLEVATTSDRREAITLEEAAALHVVRRSSIGEFGGGLAEADLVEKLSEWGVGDGTSTAELLASKGLIRDRDLPLSREARSRAPVFLVFSPRSGSNMLRWLLEAHPKFTCPPPSPILHLLLDAIDEPASASAYRSLRSPKPWTRRIMRGLVEEAIEEVARRSGKPRWCFRHWVSYRRLHGIDELFGATPLYVFLIRHALDVVDAACKVYVPAETWQAGPNGQDLDFFKAYGGSPHIAYAHFWREVNQRMQEFQTVHPDRVHVLSYEDLVERPSAILSGLFDFLGEDCPDDIEERAFKRPARMLPAWEGHELTRTQRIEGGRVGLWRSWDPGLINATAPIVNDTLAAWGYERVPTTEESDG